MAGRRKPVPDVLGPGVDVLFVGINPGLVSAREGHHFANPANAFWRLMHESGMTPRPLRPAEERELLAYGIGLTNLVSRASKGAADLTPQDFARGRRQLSATIRKARVRAIVFVGVMAYRAFAGKSGPIACGEQAETLAGARVFVVPNPSGRNAHYKPAEMLDQFRAVARALGRGAG